MCEYLDYYRSILFLQHDIMVRHCLKRTFLLKDRTEAMQVSEDSLYGMYVCMWGGGGSPYHVCGTVHVHV